MPSLTSAFHLSLFPGSVWGWIKTIVACLLLLPLLRLLLILGACTTRAEHKMAALERLHRWYQPCCHSVQPPLPSAVLFNFLAAVIVILGGLWLLVVWTTRRICLGKATYTRPFGITTYWSLAPIRWAARGILWCLGVWWIEERVHTEPGEQFCTIGAFLRGSNAPRILVAKHTSLLDGLYFASRCVPILVVKEEFRDVPIAGAVVDFFQPVWVPRSRQRGEGGRDTLEVMRETMQRAVKPGRPLVIFPEGTVTNQQAMLQFRKGVFTMGTAVTPVAISYPHCSLDISWAPEMPAMYLLLRMLCQVRLEQEERERRESGHFSSLVSSVLFAGVQPNACGIFACCGACGTGFCLCTTRSGVNR